MAVLNQFNGPMFILLKQDNYHILGIQCTDISSFQSFRKKKLSSRNASKNATKDRMFFLTTTKSKYQIFQILAHEREIKMSYNWYPPQCPVY